MAIPLTINGEVFEYPQNFDQEWGADATGWAQAVTAGALYLSGGNFPLTSAVDFGSSFGIKVKSVTSETLNPATAGYLLLAKTDSISFRNNANSANLLLAIDGSDNLTFNGTPLGTTSLTNAHIFVGNASNVPADVAMSGDATIANTGALTIANSAITNAKVSASAAIAVSKLAALTASKAVQTDSGGLLQASTVTSTELGYLSGVTGPIQTQLGTYLPLAGGTMSGAISMASHKITAVTQGASTGEAIAFPVDTAQISANAVTQPLSSTSGTPTSNLTVITGQSITTTGGVVLIIASAVVNISGPSATSLALTVNVTRTGTSLPGAASQSRADLIGAAFSQVTFSAPIVYVDTPAAGTYTYQLSYAFTGGSASVTDFSLVVVELKK